MARSLTSKPDDLKWMWQKGWIVEAKSLSSLVVRAVIVSDYDSVENIVEILQADRPRYHSQL